MPCKKKKTVVIQRKKKRKVGKHGKKIGLK